MELITRMEYYLAKAAGLYEAALPLPITRMEQFIGAITGDYSGTLPEPITAEEMYLAKIAGVYTGTLPTPTTRREYYLAKKAEVYEGEVPMAITREEVLLAAWAAVPNFEVATLSGRSLTLENSLKGPLEGLRVFGRSSQTVTTGAQLLRVFSGKNGTGLTYTEKDGMLYVDGTASKPSGADTDFYLVGGNGVYEDAGFPVGNIAVKAYDLPKGLTFYVVKNGGSVVVQFPNANDYITFSHAEGDTYRIMFRNDAVTFQNAPIKMMLNTGNVIKPWEPYSRGIASPSPEYPQPVNSIGSSGQIAVKLDDQTLILSTPGGMPGVPEETGANYTDADGKQYVCDEVDLARGVYVQRVKLATMEDRTWGDAEYASSKRMTTALEDARDTRVRTAVLSNRFMTSKSSGEVGNMFSYQNKLYVYLPDTVTSAAEAQAWFNDNPTEVYYILKTPIERPLTDAEIAAYSALKTKAGQSVVSNDADAWMEVKYRRKAGK